MGLGMLGDEVADLWPMGKIMSKWSVDREFAGKREFGTGCQERFLLHFAVSACSH